MTSVNRKEMLANKRVKLASRMAMWVNMKPTSENSLVNSVNTIYLVTLNSLIVDRPEIQVDSHHVNKLANLVNSWYTVTLVNNVETSVNSSVTMESNLATTTNTLEMLASSVETSVNKTVTLNQGQDTMVMMVNMTETLMAIVLHKST